MLTRRSSSPLSAYASKISSFLFISLLIVAGCSKDDDPGTGTGDQNKTECLLVREVLTGSGFFTPGLEYSINVTIDRSFDDKGNMLSYDHQYTETYKSGQSSSMLNKLTYQFNNEGYLTRFVGQYRNTDAIGGVRLQTVNEDLTYTGGRLVKSVYQNNNDGQPSNRTVEYQYDAAGKITQLTSSPDNTTIRFEYNGQVVSKITRTDANGNSTSPLLEYNSKGLLTKSITLDGASSQEYRYQYDEEGNVTREERYQNNQPVSARDFEFDKKVNPYFNASARAKGQVTIPNEYAIDPLKRNTTRTVTYVPNAAKTGFEVDKVEEVSFTYNASNLPTGATAKVFDGKGALLNSTTKTFTYDNCK